MHVLITGADGFIGRNLARTLLEAGHEVTGMIEPGRASPDPRIHTFAGDLREPASWPSWRGIDVVVHTAGRVSGPGSWTRFRRTNVGGTRAVIDAAAAGGVRRLVHLSSSAVMWDGTRMFGADESAPLPRRHRDPYSATKAAGERLVRLAGEAGRIETVAVRPALVWGPDDSTMLPDFAAIGSTGRYPLIGDGGTPLATTYIGDLVTALIALVESRRRPAPVYLVADATAQSFAALMRGVLTAIGLPGARPLRVPAVVAVWVAGVLKGMTGHPQLEFGMRMASTPTTLDADRIRREMGLASTPFEDGLAALGAWARAVGGPAVIASRAWLPNRPAP